MTSRFSPTRTFPFHTPLGKQPPLTPYSPTSFDDYAVTSPSSSGVESIFEEAKLRDMLIQRRITREGLSWEALPYMVQREVDAIRDLYSAASVGGHVQANHNLGLMYYLGKGVGKNIRHAVGLLQAAADRGHAESSFILSHAEAQYNLGVQCVVHPFALRCSRFKKKPLSPVRSLLVSFCSFRVMDASCGTRCAAWNIWVKQQTKAT